MTTLLARVYRGTQPQRAGSLQIYALSLGVLTVMLPLRDGQALLLNIYWQSLQPLPYDYAVFLHLQNTQGQIVAQRDTVIRAYDYPTSRWQVGELAIDLADLAVPSAIPPGQYKLEMGVYHMESMVRSDHFVCSFSALHAEKLHTPKM